MAGIGFELKKLLKQDKLSSIFKVYGYSAILSSGPWMISILAILFIGIIKTYNKKFILEIIQFQVSVTYILALSLIFSSIFQLSFSRYASNKIFKKEEEKILPSYFGVIIILFSIGSIISIFFSYFLLKETSALFVILFISSLCVLSGIWIANTLLLGIKKYKTIFFSYLVSYSLIILISIFIHSNKLEGLLISFFIGNSLLFFFLSGIIIKNYRSDEIISFDFLYDKKDRILPCLIWGSLFYNIGIWIDKFLFWFSKNTGYKVISKLNASVVYDLPIFLAYLSIIPGMAIFFYRLEADFAEKYESFYQSVREGGTLKNIINHKNDIVETLRIMIREVIIIQGIFNIIIYFYSPKIFELLNMPKLYLPLFHIDLISVQIQLGLMSILSVLHYLDKRKEAMWISFIFAALNFVLTYITINYLGPNYFGYGFGISVLISFIISLFVIKKTLKDLEYETFMLN